MINLFKLNDETTSKTTFPTSQVLPGFGRCLPHAQHQVITVKEEAQVSIYHGSLMLKTNTVLFRGSVHANVFQYKSYIRLKKY